LRVAPETFQKIIDRPLVCTKLPGTPLGFAMWSKGQRGGAAGEIPATSPAALAGEVARGVYELRGLDLGAYSRWRGNRRSGAADVSDGGLWELCSSEPAARVGQQASMDASLV
jgi:hypothetical protein